MNEQTCNMRISLAAPVIYLLDGSPIPTTGGMLTITGGNFGYDVSNVHVGTIPTGPFSVMYVSDATIICSAPPGTGANIPLILKVGPWGLFQEADTQGFEIS